MKKVRVFVTLDICMSAFVNLEIGQGRLMVVQDNMGSHPEDDDYDESWVLEEAAREIINEGIGNIWGSIQPENDVTKVRCFDVDVELADDE